MKELAGRLSALDPEATEALKVIAYFDALIDGRVGADAMLRGAAVLSGAIIGHRSPGRPGRRFGPDGEDEPPGEPDGWATAAVADAAVIWLERTGPAHANDAMVLERLGLSLSILSRRLDADGPARRALETLLTGDATEDERDEAWARLRLGSASTGRVVAALPSSALPASWPQVVTPTRVGQARVALAPAEEAGRAASPARAGIGTAVGSPGEVRASLRAALVALRLTDETTPVVLADELGALLLLAETQDHAGTAHPDVLRLHALLSVPRSERMLRALADGDSQRSIATRAGVHHSTIAARLHELPTALGFDPTTPRGRTRLDVALLLHRLHYARLDA
jgi:hypothetical protein